MQNYRKHNALSALKLQIAGIENRKSWSAGERKALEGSQLGKLAIAPGVLHEIFTDERRNGATSLGFALGQARGLLTSGRQVAFFMQLTHEAQETGLPYGSGLSSFGFDSDTLILGRMKTMTELLWAMEEAIACDAVAAIIADVGGHPKAFDFTASRRLSMRANTAGTSVFVLRYGREREATAAQLRWHVTPQLSAQTPFNIAAPGELRWLTRLEKGRIGQSMEGLDAGWILGWTQNGFTRIENSRFGAKPTVSRPPVSGAAPAALGDRLRKTA